MARVSSAISRRAAAQPGRPGTVRSGARFRGRRHASLGPRRGHMAPAPGEAPIFSLSNGKTCPYLFIVLRGQTARTGPGRLTGGAPGILPRPYHASGEGARGPWFESEKIGFRRRETASPRAEGPGPLEPLPAPGGRRFPGRQADTALRARSARALSPVPGPLDGEKGQGGRGAQRARGLRLGQPDRTHSESPISLPVSAGVTAATRARRCGAWMGPGVGGPTRRCAPGPRERPRAQLSGAPRGPAAASLASTAVQARYRRDGRVGRRLLVASAAGLETLVKVVIRNNIT